MDDPGNRGIAFSAEATYGVYEVTAIAENSNARVGEKLILADELADAVKEAAGIDAWTRNSEASELDGVVCTHPLHGKGYDFDVPVLPGGFVTMEQALALCISAPAMAWTTSISRSHMGSRFRRLWARMALSTITYPGCRRRDL